MMTGRMEPLAVLLVLTALTAACDPAAPSDSLSFAFDFSTGAHGFEGGFSDVAVAEADNVGFVADHRPLPDPLHGAGLYHSGLNVSDDLFMFFTRRVDGLERGGRYEASLELGIASSHGEDCEVGVGSGVLVKAGAAGQEVRRVIVFAQGRDEYRLNVDKGEQANDGPAAVIIGDIRNGLPGCGDDVPFALETVRAPSKTLTLQADADGTAWLFFGTESTFEAFHEVYFTTFRVDLVPLD